ncbi:MAG: hemerythrin domain-containing protein [Bacteroidota bacterium]
MHKPIKRHVSIQPLSREHHQDLLLCWKIRTGFSKGVQADRIKKYADWFFETHMKDHFHAEETHLFPILGEDHELVKKAMAHHRRLTRLFASKTDLTKTLNQIEEELEQHVRFEERVLFNEIQAIATPEQLQMIQEVLKDHPFSDNTEDVFWV